jgi:hypothetical protein
MIPESTIQVGLKGFRTFLNGMEKSVP